MARNADGGPDEPTQKRRVLRVLKQAEDPNHLSSREVGDRLPNDSLSGVRGTLSVLDSEGYAVSVEFDDRDAQVYDITVRGLEHLNEETTDEGASTTDEAATTEGEGLQISVSGPAERVERVENLLSATGDGGETRAKIALPVADRSADLDHARVLSKLGKSSLIRPYLRALLGLPGEDAPDRTASEQRADVEDSVEVVEKANAEQ